MLSPGFFINTLSHHGINFYAGVPDSLLKNVCAYITDHIAARHHIIAANEGGAVALAAGYHLATGKVGAVYMQNSGEGNAVNPLASLTDSEVYRIPLLLIIGWRGRPGVHDEPQHVKQGKVTLPLLDVMGIRHAVLSPDESEAAEQIATAMKHIQNTGEAYALVVCKDTFAPYTLQNTTANNLSVSREEAIQAVANATSPDDVIVSTTGMISRELFEYRTRQGQGHERDFLTVGSMGHASQIALGIALEKPCHRVWCFDGDGAALMHLGALAIIGQRKPTNFRHVVFNNGAHDSVGGQPTVGLDIDLPAIASAVGYRAIYSVDTLPALTKLLNDTSSADGPLLIQVCVKKGNRKDLGRPTTTPIQNKDAFMEFLKD